jgi:hypothetical protein
MYATFTSIPMKSINTSFLGVLGVLAVQKNVLAAELQRFW